MTEQPVTDDAPATTPDRRRFLLGGAMAAAAAASAVVAGAEPAGAGTGNGTNFTLGAANSATATTTLSTSTLKVQPAAGQATLSDDAAVWGVARGTGDVAVLGEWTGTSGSGTGVRGSTAKGTGVVGQASDAGGVGVAASAPTGAPLVLDSNTIAIPPTSGTWSVGSFAVSNGHVWYCYSGGVGAASKWVRLSAAFVPLTNPTRVYDSRAGQPPTTSVAKGLLSAPNSRIVSVTETGVIPAGVSAVTGNLTIADTSAAGGFLSVFPNGQPQPGTSNLNWTGAGQVVANAFTVKVDAEGKLRVAAGGSPSSSCNFILDITGYYL